VLDGVFSQGDDADAEFHAASQLTQAHWLDLQRVVQRRVLQPPRLSAAKARTGRAH